MKTSSSKSYGQHRPLHCPQERGIAFRQQEASPKPTVHLLQQTACGTFRPSAHPSRLSTSITCTTQPSNTVHTREYPQRAITTASVAVQPTHMADHTQHRVAANATSQEGSLTMHTRTPPDETTTLQVKNKQQIRYP